MDFDDLVSPILKLAVISMKNRRQMTEIILLCLSAIITVGLSINTIIQSNKKEKELNNKQEELLFTQKKVSDQSEEIISLQKKLQKKSDIQIDNLIKLNNPIPNELKLTFFSKIQVTKAELEILSNISKSNGNLLPSSSEDTGIDRIDKLKNVQFIIDVTFKKGTKELKVKFSQAPFQFMGYSTGKMKSVGTLITSEKELSFYAINLLTSDIKTNYSSPSLVDFYGSEVTATLTFAFPKPSRNGGRYINLYLVEIQNQIPLSLESISLETNQHTITIDNFKKLNGNSFIANWKN